MAEKFAEGPPARVGWKPPVGAAVELTENQPFESLWGARETLQGCWQHLLEHECPSVPIHMLPVSRFCQSKNHTGEQPLPLAMSLLRPLLTKSNIAQADKCFLSPAPESQSKTKGGFGPGDNTLIIWRKNLGKRWLIRNHLRDGDLCNTQ